MQEVASVAFSTVAVQQHLKVGLELELELELQHYQDEQSEDSYFVPLPTYDFSSTPTFAFASHGFGGWLPELARIPDNVRLCSDDNGSKHTENLRSVALDISGSYILQYASTNVSCLHNVV